MSTVAASETRDSPLGFLRMPRTILFGSGQLDAVGQAVAGLGQNALICTDARLAGSHELTRVVSSLGAAGVRATVYANSKPELPLTSIAACVSESKAREPDVVVGFGGGSCLDMAKIVALLLEHGGSPEDYYGELRVPGPVMPIVAVPTTAGTGSEVTPVAVVSDPSRTLKVGISSPHLIPQAAICDPDLTRSCPPPLTASTGIDALAHVVEAYTAVRRASTARLAHERVYVGKSDLADPIAIQGAKLLGRSLVRAYTDGEDAEARAEVMFGALAGGIAFGTSGVAAAHALQYPIGAITHTSHGVGVGTLLPYVMRYNFPARIPEFAALGRALVDDPISTDDVEAARSAVFAVDAMVRQLGLPEDLRGLGLPGDRVKEVAELAMSATRLIENNPRPLDVDALLAITQAAFRRDRTIAELSSRDHHSVA